ncbi:MAG: hypothetical protein JKY34_11215 [Kordiimonadaceae bacterium]|nr:hypothetical protein [Kordiimonadaceae bacterium]
MSFSFSFSLSFFWEIGSHIFNSMAAGALSSLPNAAVGMRQGLPCWHALSQQLFGASIFLRLKGGLAIPSETKGEKQMNLRRNGGPMTQNWNSFLVRACAVLASVSAFSLREYGKSVREKRREMTRALTDLGESEMLGDWPHVPDGLKK